MDFIYLYWVAVLASIGLIGYTYYCFHTKRRDVNVNKDKLINNTSNHDIDLYESTIDTIRNKKGITLTPIIKYFKGQCNSFKIVAEKPRNIENCEKTFKYADDVINFHADGNLKEWWNLFSNARNQWDLALYSEKAKQILSMLYDSGVISSSEHIIEWNENTSKHYIPFDDIEEGDICNVIYPYWKYQDEIFEQGIVSKKH